MKLETISRQQFIQRSIFGGIGLTLPLSLDGQMQKANEKPTALKPELVKEFVGVCHSNMAKVKELLDSEPQLLHSSWDWGGGDFESGIEAAGHVGNKEIATLLLGKGARYNIYLACMLGHLEVVKLVMGTNPNLLNSKGPHGFTMLHHANKGGDESKAAVEYLVSLGAKETKFDFYAKA